MKTYQIAALMVTMTVFTGCDDDGETKGSDAGSDAGLDAISHDAAQAGGGSGGVVGGPDASSEDANNVGLDASGGLDGGGGGGTGGLAFSTSVAGTKVVAELNNAEQAQLCSDADKWKIQLKNAGFSTSLCRVLAVVLIQTRDKTEAEVRMDCEARVKGCAAQLEAMDPDERCNIAPPVCNITVAELQKCKTDRTIAMKTLADSLPACANSKISDFGMLPGGDGLVPASCKAAEERCPGISD